MGWGISSVCWESFAIVLLWRKKIKVLGRILQKQTLVKTKWDPGILFDYNQEKSSLSSQDSSVLWSLMHLPHDFGIWLLSTPPHSASLYSASVYSTSHQKVSFTQSLVQTSEQPGYLESTSYFPTCFYLLKKKKGFCLVVPCCISAGTEYDLE